MSAADVLLKPEQCVMLLVDFQAGLGFGVESSPRQLVVNGKSKRAMPIAPRWRWPGNWWPT